MLFITLAGWTTVAAADFEAEDEIDSALKEIERSLSELSDLDIEEWEALELEALELEDPFEEISYWERIFVVRVGAGYKDNVMLSPFRTDQSPFISTGLEFILWRLPFDGTQFHLLLAGDDVRYLSADEVDGEQLFIASSQLKRDFGNRWHGGVSVQYIFQNQVLDVSATELDLHTVRVVSRSFGLRPVVRRDLPWHGWVELEPEVTRNSFNAPLDGYWEGGPKLTLGRQYNRRSELSLSYQLNYRQYDERQKVDAEGFRLPDTSLAFRQHKVYFTWRHHWDEARRWRTQARLGWERNRDNGPGFFDYRRYYVGGQLRYRAEKWEAQGNVRLSHYRYPAQPVDLDDDRRRRRTDVIGTLRAERKLTRHFSLFGQYEYERALSNQDFGRYAVNTISGGVQAEF